MDKHDDEKSDDTQKFVLEREGNGFGKSVVPFCSVLPFCDIWDEDWVEWYDEYIIACMMREVRENDKETFLKKIVSAVQSPNPEHKMGDQRISKM